MKKTIVKKIAFWGILVSVVVFSSMAYSHCQIPCGIYNDERRFDTIAEHITTIEKSMNMTVELSSKDKPNMNQIVRWVNNKEKHADEISNIVTYYFMAQRVKPAEKDDAKGYEQYVKKLTLLHEILIYSMKAKQTTDLANVEKLRSSLSEFRSVYFSESAHKH